MHAAKRKETLKREGARPIMVVKNTLRSKKPFKGENMKKLHLTLLLAVLALLFAACAPATVGDGDNDALIESDASTAATDCSGLTGDYEATRFGYTSVSDPGVTSAFADTGASYRLGFDGGSFDSTFADPQTGALEQTGAYGYENDVLTLGDDASGAFFPGAAGGAQRYRCEVRDGGFVLTSNEPVGYDFGSGVENAVFEGEFSRF